MRIGGNARCKNGGKFERKSGETHSASERKQQHERRNGGKCGVGGYAGMSGMLRGRRTRRSHNGDAIDIAADDHELEHLASGIAPEREIRLFLPS